MPGACLSHQGGSSRNAPPPPQPLARPNDTRTGHGTHPYGPGTQQAIRAANPARVIEQHRLPASSSTTATTTSSKEPGQDASRTNAVNPGGVKVPVTNNHLPTMLSSTGPTITSGNDNIVSPPTDTDGAVVSGTNQIALANPTAAPSRIPGPAQGPSTSGLSGMVMPKPGSNIPAGLPRPPPDQPVATVPDREATDALTAEEVALHLYPSNWTRGNLIGAGAFGKVYMGLNNETGEIFAVKQVALPKDEQLRGRVMSHIRALEKEVDVLRQLRNVHIVQYMGTEKTEDTLNIFLEYVAGGSIASLIDKVGALQENVVRVYTKQILKGLEYLHEKKIMHRDIKGANILVDNQGTVKLADFGASKNIEDLATVGSMSAVEAKSIKGTPYWMAPEVIKQTGHGRPADIWSLGCCIIEMATGKPPWSNCHNPVAAMWHIASTGEIPALPSSLSPEARDFLRQCFNRMPRERPPAKKLLQHPWLAGVQLPSGSSAGSTSVSRLPIPSRLPPSPIKEESLAAIREEMPSPSLPAAPAVAPATQEVSPPVVPGAASAALRNSGIGMPPPVQYETIVSRSGLPEGAFWRDDPQQQQMGTELLSGGVLQDPDAAVDAELQDMCMYDQTMGSVAIPPSMLTLNFNPMEEPSWMPNSAQARMLAAIAAGNGGSKPSPKIAAAVSTGTVTKSPRSRDQMPRLAEDEDTSTEAGAEVGDVRVEPDQPSPRVLATNAGEAVLQSVSKPRLAARDIVPPLPPLTHNMGMPLPRSQAVPVPVEEDPVRASRMQRWKDELLAELDIKRQEQRTSMAVQQQSQRLGGAQ